jgi:hypothetical protein
LLVAACTLVEILTRMRSVHIPVAMHNAHTPPIQLKEILQKYSAPDSAARGEGRALGFLLRFCFFFSAILKTPGLLSRTQSLLTTAAAASSNALELSYK